MKINIDLVTLTVGLAITIVGGIYTGWEFRNFRRKLFDKNENRLFVWLNEAIMGSWLVGALITIFGFLVILKGLGFL